MVSFAIFYGVRFRLPCSMRRRHHNVPQGRFMMQRINSCRKAIYDEVNSLYNEGHL